MDGEAPCHAMPCHHQYVDRCCGRVGRLEAIDKAGDMKAMEFWHQLGPFVALTSNTNRLSQSIDWICDICDSTTGQRFCCGVSRGFGFNLVVQVSYESHHLPNMSKRIPQATCQMSKLPSSPRIIKHPFNRF